VDLVLSAVTQQLVVTPQSQNLIADIKAIPVNNIQDLKARTTADWNSSSCLLGAVYCHLYAPGTPAERVAAFIRHLREILRRRDTSRAVECSCGQRHPQHSVSQADPINTFVGFYNANPTPPFAFGSPVNQAFFDQAIQDVFPNDAEPQAWLVQTLHAIDELFRMTTGIDPTLQFSLMEALYARGFDSMINVQALSASEFEQALTGTVAYPFANQIYVVAGAYWRAKRNRDQASSSQ